MIKVRRVTEDQDGNPIYPVVAVSVYRAERSRYETVRLDDTKSVFDVDAETAYALFTEESAKGAFVIDEKSIARLKKVGKVDLETASLVGVLRELEVLPSEDEEEEKPARRTAPTKPAETESTQEGKS